MALAFREAIVRSPTMLSLKQSYELKLRHRWGAKPRNVVKLQHGDGTA
jgi:hypothetical protein